MRASAGLLAFALAAGGAAAQELAEPIPRADLQLVSEVVRLVRRDYAREVDDAVLASSCADALAAASGSSERAARSLEALPGLLGRAHAAAPGLSYRKLAERCIEGMVGVLDKHSQYVDEEEARYLYRGAPGVAATGLEVRKDGSEIVVVDVYDDSPAAKAGLRAGDALLRIDGLDTAALSLRDAVFRLRGAVGSQAALVVKRRGAAKPLELVAKREIIRMQSVRAAWLDGEVLELRVARLTESTRADLMREILKLAGAPPREPRGIVLDLRGNTGGLLTSAVDLAGLFLEKGTPVGSTRGRGGRLIEPYVASDRAGAFSYSTYQAPLPERLATALKKAPLVVLVGKRTASGGEILAAALQANGRARLAGERTLGMGSIQTLFPLPPGGGMLKLTTAFWHGPKEAGIDDQPLQPDLPGDEQAALGAALAALRQAR